MKSKSHLLGPMLIGASSLLIWSGCRDTIFKSNSDKTVQKQGSDKDSGGSEGENGNSGDTDANQKGDTLTTDFDQNGKGGKGGDDDDDILNGGKNGFDNDDAKPGSKNNRRNRPGIGLLQAWNGIGGDTPLALDWNQDGAFHSNAEHGAKVVFDLSGLGRPAPVEWLKPGDRWLALDRNHNGKIDDGTELFGSGTRLKGTLPLRVTADHGFMALAQYDLNQDGQIDKLDPIFNDLLLWDDKNSNGESEPEELLRANNSGLISLSLKATELKGRQWPLPRSQAYVGWVSEFSIQHGTKITKHHLVDLFFPNFMHSIAKK